MVDNVLVAAVVAVVAVGIIAGASRAPLPLKKDRSRVGWTHGIVPCCNVQRPSRPQKHSQQRFSLSLSLSLSAIYRRLSLEMAIGGFGSVIACAPRLVGSRLDLALHHSDSWNHYLITGKGRRGKVDSG